MAKFINHEFMTQAEVSENFINKVIDDCLWLYDAYANDDVEVCRDNINESRNALECAHNELKYIDDENKWEEMDTKLCHLLGLLNHVARKNIIERVFGGKRIPWDAYAYINVYWKAFADNPFYFMDVKDIVIKQIEKFTFYSAREDAHKQAEENK